jgi:putative MATE family efflux protein
VLQLVWPVLLFPVLLEQMLGLSVGFTDKWLAGNLLEGAEPLAAVGVVAYCLSFLPGLFAVPAVAATALVARSVGAGDLPGARRAAAQSLLLASGLTIVFLTAVTVFGGSFVRALGLPSGSTALATRYLAIVLPALPAMMIIHVGVAVLRGAGDMWAGLLAMSVVNLVNAAASFALAVGLAGLPRLGWEGLAWGTTAGYCLGAGCVIVLLGRRARGLRPRRRDWLPDRGWLGRILHVGIPAGVDAIGNAACHLGFLSIVNRLGDVAAAAHSVAITIESLAFLPGSAFMVVAATLAGQFLGAGDERRARRSVWQATLACMALMSAAGLVFLTTADTLAGWFVGGSSRQPEVAALTARLVRIVAFAQPPLALLMVLSGGLRGAGATRLPLAVNFLGLVLVRLPLAVFLARDSVVLPAGLGTVDGLGLAAVGAWYAMAADLTVRGLAMLLLFTRRNWSRVAV